MRGNKYRDEMVPNHQRDGLAVIIGDLPTIAFPNWNNELDFTLSLHFK